MFSLAAPSATSALNEQPYNNNSNNIIMLFSSIILINNPPSMISSPFQFLSALLEQGLIMTALGC